MFHKAFDWFDMDTENLVYFLLFDQMAYAPLF